MKNIFFMILAVLLFFQPLFAQEKEENKKLEIKPYGFIKADMVYATAGVYSWGNPVNNYLSAPQFASGKEQSAIGFTAQHTRLGLKGTVGEKVKAGGLVEIDFYGGAFDANIKPRIRLAYVSITNGGFEARMGQQWDIFSPNNANTNNTNGNMWYSGNRGFRRAQIQLSYKIENKMIAPMIQLSVGETSKEESGLGKDNMSGLPMFQARISGKIVDKYIFGLSCVSTSFLETKGAVESLGTIKDTLTSDLKYYTSGIGVDFNLPFHKYFSLLGEFNAGTNLNDANLFNIAGNYSWGIEDATKSLNKSNKKSTGFWFNATSNITDWLNVVVGYGMDKNTTSNLGIGAIEKNTVFYGDLVFPIKHGFTVALEVQNIKTTAITNVVDNQIERKNNIANVINLSSKISF